jgi:hypothetical protein
MPQAIAWAVSAIGAELGSAAMMMYATEIAYAAVVIGGMAYSGYQAKKAEAAAKDQYNAAAVDRLVNISSSVAPRELVMGRVRKGGAVIYKASTGTVNRSLYMAIALAGHEIDAIESIYLNDVLVTVDGDGYVQTPPYAATNTTYSGTVNTGAGLSATLPAGYIAGTASGTYYGNIGPSQSGPDRFGDVPCSISVAGLTATAEQANTTIQYQYTSTASYVRIWQHLGTPGQAADAELMAAFPDDWKSTAVVAGVAYIVVKFFYDETAFPSGAPNVTVVMRGAKLYDPRTGNTTWSQNPALMARHVYQHPKFGKATPTAAEEARFVAAANACDIAQSYHTLASTAADGTP